MTSPRHLILAVGIAATLALTGCATGAAGEADATPTSSTDTLEGTLTVYAAASLSGAFDELAAEFEAAHPDVDVAPITYDGSSVLATQLIEGASADVFASADVKNMTKVTDAGIATAPEDFATNVLTIAVAPGNPLRIDGLADLADPGKIVVTCAPEVPCGAAAQKLLDSAGVALTPASEEQNVTAVLAKVKAGEADAGLVYVTDVTAAEGAVDGVEIDGADADPNVYPIVALDDAPNPDTAAAFTAFVTSPAGQKVLASFGFGAP